MPKQTAADELAEYQPKTCGTPSWLSKVSPEVLSELEEIRRRWHLPSGKEKALSHLARAAVYKWCRDRWGELLPCRQTTFIDWLSKEPT